MFNIFKSKSQKELEDKIIILRERLEKKDKEVHTPNLTYTHFEENREDIERKEKEEKEKAEEDKSKQEKISKFINKFEDFFLNNYIKFYEAICTYLTNGGKVVKIDDYYALNIKDDKHNIDIDIKYYYQDTEILCNGQLFTFSIINAFKKLNKLHHGNTYDDSFLKLLISSEKYQTEYPYEKLLKEYENKIDNLLFSSIYENIFNDLKSYISITDTDNELDTNKNNTQEDIVDVDLGVKTIEVVNS